MSPEIERYLLTIAAGTFGAIVGASISGYIALKNGLMQFRRSVADREKLDRGNEIAMLQVLDGDLRALSELHSQAAGMIASLKDGDFLASVVPVTLNYFSVFENNVTQLGRITNPELRTRIIFVYQKAKSLIDSLRRNNELLGEYWRWEIEARKSDTPLNQERFAKTRQNLIYYAEILKVSSMRLTAEISGTIADFETELKELRARDAAIRVPHV